MIGQYPVVCDRWHL